MADMKISPKMSSKEARSAIASKLKDKTLSLAEQRRLKEQYTNTYAKGGAVTKKQQAKIGTVMGEYKEGKLHSGAGKKAPIVKSQKQAVAIALSEAGVAKKKK